jgi:predicted negative regulator of RcsB-dependent stress response
MKRAVITLSIILLWFLLIPSILLSETGELEFRVQAPGEQEEITVKRDTSFTVYIDGQGWYLKRYDRSKLSFKKRIAETKYTAFTIHPSVNGSSFLLFRYVDKDIHLPVNIVESLPEDETADLDSNESDQTTNDGGKKPGDGDTSKENELYYINKENQIVKIPTTNENDLYFKGITLNTDGNYDDAARALDRYVEICERCRYRDSARLVLAEISMKLNNEKEALDHLDSLAESGNPSIKNKALIKKAEIHYKAQRYSNAADAYRKAYDSGNEDTGILEKLGDIYLLMDDYTGALKVYEEGISQGLSNDKIIFRVANFYDKPGALRNIERAYHYYKIIVEKYEASVHYAEATERVQFFEKNFFNYQ